MVFCSTISRFLFRSPCNSWWGRGGLRLTSVMSTAHSRARFTPSEIESGSRQAKPQAMQRRASDVKPRGEIPPKEEKGFFEAE